MGNIKNLVSLYGNVDKFCCNKETEPSFPSLNHKWDHYESLVYKISYI